MKNLKVLLTDPRHDTVGLHSSYVPIGLGYIGTYLIKKLENINIKLEISTNTEETFNLLENWKPDIIGSSNYMWNSALTNTICEYAKKINPNILCIMGGPEFPVYTGARKVENTTSDKSYDKTLKYLIDRPSVDYFAYSDGEVAFLEIVKTYVENNFSIKSLKDKDEPIKGSVSVSKDKKKLLVGDHILRIGLEGSVKAHGRDIIPSPYLAGLFDKYLDGTFIPAFETARGCPFLCTFCDRGLDPSKISSFGTKRMYEELVYVGKKLHKLKNGTKTVIFYDANWGMYQKDVELGDEMLKIIEKYDWPKNIYIQTPKSHMNNVLKINDKLKNRVNFAMAMQSLNSETLTKVKRTNWTREQYVDFAEEMRKRGKTASSDIIFPLPGETKETYLEGVKFLMDHNTKPITSVLLMLSGTELGRDEAIKKYGMIAKYRLLPKEFGEYHGKKIFEIEKACVGTNTLSHEDYLYCRNYSFLQELLTNLTFAPVHKLTKKIGISWYDVTRKTLEAITDKKFKGKLKDLFNEFCLESRNELFNSKEEAINFYSKPENYQSLKRGDIGENLLAKYTAKGLLVFDDILKTVYQVIRSQLINSHDRELDAVLNSSEKWLKNLYMIKEIFGDNINAEKNNKHMLKMDYDFPAWLLADHQPFINFKKESTYELDFDFDKINYIHNELNTVYKADKERRFLGYLLKLNITGVDLWKKRARRIS